MADSEMGKLDKQMAYEKKKKKDLEDYVNSYNPKKTREETPNADAVVKTVDKVKSIFTKEEEPQRTDQYGGNSMVSVLKRGKQYK